MSVQKISKSRLADDETNKDILELIHDEIVAIRNTLAGVLVGSVAWNPADMADGAGETKDVTVTGAALGDFAIASVELDLAGCTISAYVKATDTVSVRVQNESGSALNGVDFGTCRVFVIKKTALALAAKLLSKS